MRLGSLAALAAGLAYLGFSVLVNPLEGLQNSFTDALFREQQGSANIVIIGIDDATLEEYGRFNTWSRSLHASAIQNLHDAGARVIVYDILFGDVSDEDAELAAAIESAGNVVLAAAGNTPATAGGPATYVYGDFALPAPSVRDAAAVIAHANIETADDGRVRRVPLFVADTDGQAYPSLSLAAFALQFGGEPPAPAGGDSLALFGREVPLEDRMTVRVNYAGDQNSFIFLPFANATTGNFEPSALDGKVAFVGLTATGADRHSTPLLGNAAGVEIHANALDTLLRARFLEPVATWIEALIGAGFVLAAAYAVPRWRIGLGGALVVGLLAVYGVVSVFVFYQGRIVNAVDPAAALLLAAAVGLTSRVLAERAAQREVEDLFGRYVSHDVAQELMERADHGRLALGGEVREVTVLFGDIRGFTPLSIGMDPHELVETVNVYFDHAVASILEHEGVVNKFIGDAIMAVWNAPRDQPEHALLACRAAMKASALLEAIEASGPPVRFGFGITTGPALAGNVGAHGRLEYTVMGETVNTSSRLSGAASGGEVWVDSQTRELVQEYFEVELMPPQQLKGMSESVVVYKVVRELVPSGNG